MAENSVMTTLVVTYLNAVNQLQQKCAACAAIRDDESKPKLDRAEAGLAALDISEDIARLQAAFNDMKATFAPGLPPPSNDLVNQAVALATQVGNVLKAEKNTQTLLKAITSFVNDFTAVMTGTPPPVADAARASGETPTGDTSKEAPATSLGKTDGTAKDGAVSPALAQKLTNLQWFTAHHQSKQPKRPTGTA